MTFSVLVEIAKITTQKT